MKPGRVPVFAFHFAIHHSHFTISSTCGTQCIRQIWQIDFEVVAREDRRGPHDRLPCIRGCGGSVESGDYDRRRLFGNHYSYRRGRVVPIAIAWRRRHPQAETIVPLGILWGLATAAVSIYAYITQTNWSKERLLRIESGYFDPQDNSGAPALPWLFWIILLIAFAAMIAWALRGTRAEPSADERGENESN